MGQSYFRKRKHQKYLIFLLAIVSAGVCSIVGYCTAVKLTRIEYENRLGEITNELNGYSQEVYILKQNIMQGETISNEMVRTVQVYSSITQEKYADSMDIGKTALVNMTEGDVLIKCVLASRPDEEGIRVYRCREVALPDNLRNMDYCDIRLVYPDGTSYVVIAKVQIRDISEDRSEFTMYVTEEEINLLFAASVDIMEFEGSRFCVTSYVKGELQEASIVSYTPSEEIISFMLGNPNIREIASSYLSRQVRKEIIERVRRDDE